MEIFDSANTKTQGKKSQIFSLFKYLAVNMLFQRQHDYLKFHCIKTELLYWKMFDICKSKKAHIEKSLPILLPPTAVTSAQYL